MTRRRRHTPTGFTNCATAACGIYARSGPGGVRAERARGLTMTRMGLSGIRYIYEARLGARAVLVQEGFAIVGIAVGVALLLASQISSYQPHSLRGTAEHPAPRRRPGAARRPWT